MTSQELAALQAIEVGQLLAPSDEALIRLLELGLIYGRLPRRLMLTVDGRSVLDANRQTQ